MAAATPAGSVLPALIAGGVLLVVLALVAVAVLHVSRKGDVEEYGASGNAPIRRQQPAAAAGRQTATGRMQQRLRRRRAAAAAAGDADAGSDDEGDEAGDEEGEAEPLNRREARRAERAAARAQQEGAQQHRQSKQQAYDARRAAKDAARETEERKLEEEIERLAAERVAADAAEAEKWMGQISLEAEGTGEAEAENAELLLTEFVEFIRGRKMVALDELAAEFGLRTQEAIDRVQALEAAGRLTGVMDDRGKFIYISREEMAAVAAFIKQRGRVAIAELAAKSDTLIDLEGRAAELPAGLGDDIFEEEDAAPLVHVAA